MSQRLLQRRAHSTRPAVASDYSFWKKTIVRVKQYWSSSRFVAFINVELFGKCLRPVDKLLVANDSSKSSRRQAERFEPV
jgi:hypothetical protein